MNQRPGVRGHPVQIASEVYWLPAGRGTNVYLVQSASSWTLVDAAWPGSGRLIRESAERLFGAETRPAAILLTHIHPDHMGSVMELVRTWNVPVYVHPGDLPLAAPTYPPEYLDPIGRVIEPLMRLFGTKPAESTLEDVVQGFDPSAGVPGLPEWECIPTPGHTPGHAAFFRRTDRVLITGDAILTLNFNSLWDLMLVKHRVSGPPWISTWNWSMAKQAVATLAALEPRVLAAGHGRPMISKATATALRAFTENLVLRR